MVSAVAPPFNLSAILGVFVLCTQNRAVVTGLSVRNVWRSPNNGSKLLQLASIQSRPLASHDGGEQEEIEAAERLGWVPRLARAT